ncbi:MAG TPA: hypothetical protein VN969_36720 [Streptosporangiaceae bacterium]|nr:hypothetical protein [Streptosporangiaceae bacterium]
MSQSRGFGWSSKVTTTTLLPKALPPWPLPAGRGSTDVDTIQPSAERRSYKLSAVQAGLFKVPAGPRR